MAYKNCLESSCIKTLPINVTNPLVINKKLLQKFVLFK